MSVSDYQGKVVSYLNRVVVVATTVLALVVGLIPIITNADLSSTIGIVAALGAVTAVVRKWLEGWQKHEARVFDHSNVV